MTIVDGPTHPLIIAPEVIAITGTVLIPIVITIPINPFVAVQIIQQHDIPGIFQPCIAEWNSQNYITPDNSHVYKKNSRQ